jgi:hypothetical protein
VIFNQCFSETPLKILFQQHREIDDELELGRHLNRKIAWLLAVKDAIDILRRFTHYLLQRQGNDQVLVGPGESASAKGFLLLIKTMQ